MLVRFDALSYPKFVVCPANPTVFLSLPRLSKSWSASRASRYWLQVVRADGGRRWYGPLRQG